MASFQKNFQDKKSLKRDETIISLLLQFVDEKNSRKTHATL